MVMIIGGKYGNNRSRTENVTERTRFSKSRSNDLEDIRPWRYRSRPKVITCDTPSHASDHLYEIWKESIKNCRCNRADTIFKAKAKWPWKYRSVQRSLYATHPLILVIICAKYGKNPLRTVDFFFTVKAKTFKKVAKNSNYQILKKN